MKQGKTTVYVGIDVAFAKKKPLPVAVCKAHGGVLEPLPLKTTYKKPPIGKGNRLALDGTVRKTFADDVLVWLQGLEAKEGLKIERIAIDAPSDYKTEGTQRRSAEMAMDKKGIRCFTTPSKSEFDEKIRECIAHLDDGGKEDRMPNANQIWMLVGFSLFRVLEKVYECIEVFPQAIVRSMGCHGKHKSAREGLEEQVKAIAALMNSSASDMGRKLNGMCFASKHDKLDAFLSAWVASLPEMKRVACGTPPTDVIWIPKMEQLQVECPGEKDTAK
jgi:predicted nuclease with RNAse H fold